jgi:hypothetical protein
MVEQAACEHGCRKVTAFAVRRVDLLAEPNQLLKIELSGCSHPAVMLPILLLLPFERMISALCQKICGTVER